MCLSLIRVCSITRRIATLQDMYSLSRNGPARRTRAKPSGNGSSTKRGFVPFSYQNQTTKIHVTAEGARIFCGKSHVPATPHPKLYIYTKVRALRAR